MKMRLVASIVLILTLIASVGGVMAQENEPPVPGSGVSPSNIVSEPLGEPQAVPEPETRPQQDSPAEPDSDDNYDGAPLPAPVPPEPAVPGQNLADDNYDGVPPIAPAPTEPAVQAAPVQLPPNVNVGEAPLTESAPASPVLTPAVSSSAAVFFPATGDFVSVADNPYWWHDGDYAQGVRTLPLDWITGVKYDLAILHNVLNSTGHVDLRLSINGIVVGSFTVLPGETSKSVAFSFPPIHGPTYTVRLEETNTVVPGAGSIRIPLDTSQIAFEADFAVFLPLVFK